jgi:thiol:disulfide interchange protein
MLRIVARIIIIALLTLSITSTFGQVIDPVKWTMEAVETDDNKFDIIFKSTIEEHWHVYSSVLDIDSTKFGPMPTTLDFLPNDLVTVNGELQERSKMLVEFDPNFEMDLNYYEHTAIFARNISIAPGATTSFDGSLGYMACDATQCIFPQPIDFTVDIVDGKVTSVAETVLVGDEVGFDNNSNGKGVVNPIHWDVRSESLGDDEYKIYFNATCDGDWHIYSQHLEGNEGPLPTVFVVELPEGGKTTSDMMEQAPHVEYDPNFKMELAFFEGSAEFTQTINVTGSPKIKASVDFMACDDSGCLPPELVEFTIDLATGIGQEIALEPDSIEPVDEELIWKLPIDMDNPVSHCGSEKQEQKGLFMVFLFGFIGGILALITPCVFPMIPLTVSFFTKGSGDKKKGISRAILYGFFIFAIYTALSLPFHIWKIDPQILNQISTSVTLNIIFFAVFIIFAISFFGYFEISLPNKWANKADSASNAGGILGIFFMAITLVIVSFSCTGPILGSILAGVLTQGPMPLTAGLAGFGVALGLPFALFALFPSWLNNLPKSGGWLNTTKVVLGFAEVAMAFKFFSSADLVIHTGLLHRETFFLIWFLCALGAGVYLLGLIKFPHDSRQKVKLSIPRILFASLFIGFAVYLAPGMMKEPLWSQSLIAGFAPPHSRSWYSHDNDCPLNLDCAVDLEAAIKMAKLKGQPIFIDFTGWACVNCRKMEENVWIQEEVFKLLDNEFQVVSLYVDDKLALPEDEQFKKTIVYDDGEEKVKHIRTIGDKWSTLEILSFRNSTQPLYAIITPEGKLLNPPVGYTPNSDEYVEWMKCGLDAFNAEK